jgi:hypothetical protein
MSKRNLLLASVLAILVGGAIAATAQEARKPDPKAEQRLKLAQEGFETARDYYANGTITIPRVLDWSRRLMDAEVNAGHDPSKSARAHLDRMNDLLKQEERMIEVGNQRSPNPNLLDVKYAVMEAGMLLEQAGAKK